ncbi:pyridoxamine 5'-phosphate oxidase [Kibdelosporangium banguiense]|uniref:Pyridoxamine 5'-phosphate oxidase n=1 Tax=Kibdelosporangium banguiense TaxID=1365924 RepID=A0ABS4TIX0_9PSEU|nr:pyridoxal 5'-phosphate synthase [Kibdelosporangium banguiense]MBP2324370.1 pyridoxamine 5'-phosphate oxidase [Kibdelosporangium banguiense]
MTALHIAMPEYYQPPAEPMGLFKAWFETAKAEGASEPGVVALATVDAHGGVSSRMCQTIRITDQGWVFASHTNSQKGRDIAATGRASGVFYWRELYRQLIFAGPVRQLSGEEADGIWDARNPRTLPMSVAAWQSEVLEDEEVLRAEAQRLAGQTLVRPERWVAYELLPSTVEFWHGDDPDRLYRRLRYDRTDDGWTSCRLQP